MKVRKINKAHLRTLFYLLFSLSTAAGISTFVFSLNQEVSIVLLISLMYGIIIALLPRLTAIVLRTFGPLLLIRIVLPRGFPLSPDKNLFLDIPFLILMIIVAVLIDENRDRKTGFLLKEAGRPYLSGVVLLAYPLIVFCIMNK